MASSEVKSKPEPRSGSKARSISTAALSAELNVEATFERAIRQIANLEQVATRALDATVAFFTDADIGLALNALEDDSLKPVWTNRSEVESRFMRMRGPLWELAIESFAERTTPSRKDYAQILRHAQRPIGVLVAQGCDLTQQKILNAMVWQLEETAAHLEGVRQAQRIQREMAVLNRIDQAMHRRPEFDTILDEALDAIHELFEVEAAVVTLQTLGNETWLFKKDLLAKQNWTQQVVDGEVGGILGTCGKEMKAITVENAEQDSRFNPEFDALNNRPTRTLLCAPLSAGSRVLGALGVINKRQSTRFNSHDRELLSSLASSLVGALDHAQLFLELTVANADLKSSRAQIERSRSTLIALVDNLDDELYIIDRSYALIAVNRARAERTGLDPRQLVGNTCYEVLFQRNSPCPECKVRETFKLAEKTKRSERERVGPGENIEREVFTFPILDLDENVTHTILQARDVTDQRRLEASLAQAEKLAAVGQLAAGVAHEINNPLTAVIANAQLVLRELDRGTLDREAVELIERAGRRAQEVVRDLLNFSRQEQQKYDPVDVNGSIREAMALVERQWSSSNVQLVLDLGEQLPRVLGNPNHLQSVWLNLLVNARDALANKPGKVFVRSRVTDGQILVQVQDEGAGISPEHLDHVFEPFFTTKNPGEGTGLGLATCYRIVKRHGGSIQLESFPNEGTVVTVALPVNEDRVSSNA